MRANVWASPQLYQFIMHNLESGMRCLLTHGDVGKYRRMVWKCSLKCLAHAPIVLVFLLLSLRQTRRLSRSRREDVWSQHQKYFPGKWMLTL